MGLAISCSTRPGFLVNGCTALALLSCKPEGCQQPIAIWVVCLMEIRIESTLTLSFTHTHSHTCINLLWRGQALLPCNKFCIVVISGVHPWPFWVKWQNSPAWVSLEPNWAAACNMPTCRVVAQIHVSFIVVFFLPLLLASREVRPHA